MPQNTPYFVEWVRYLKSLAESLDVRLSTRKAGALVPAVMLHSADDGQRPPHGDPTGEEAVKTVLLGYLGVAA